MRHPTSNKPILNKPVCIDDFGSMVFQCQYSKVFVSTETSIFIGPIMPNVHGTYVCAPDAMTAFRASRSAFIETEANCNTCVHLGRVKHKKNAAGFLYGKCLKGVTEHIYPINNNMIMFHPDDPMGMTCWESRRAND